MIRLGLDSVSNDSRAIKQITCTEEEVVPLHGQKLFVYLWFHGFFVIYIAFYRNSILKLRDQHFPTEIKNPIGLEFGYFVKNYSFLIGSFSCLMRSCVLFIG